METDFTVFLVLWSFCERHERCRSLKFSGIKLRFVMTQKIRTDALLLPQEFFRGPFPVNFRVVGSID